MRVVKNAIIVTLTLFTVHTAALSAAMGDPPSHLVPCGVSITATNGQKKTLAFPRFQYPNGVHYYEHHFEVVIGTCVKRSFWVHCARIKKAYFHKNGEVTEILIVSDDDRILAGLFPGDGMTLSVRGNRGYDSHALRDIKSIEFTRFTGLDGDAVIDRESASAILQKEWEKAQSSASTWVVTDTGISYENAKLVNIVDCFSTSRVGSVIYSGRTFRRCHEPESNRALTVRKYGSSADLFIDELQAIEFTGKTLSGGSYVIVVPKNIRESFSAVYPLSKAGGMVIWKTALGYESVNILPPRRITVRAYDD
jgi:hypothetical protein